jgi:hypothetical protein
MTSKLDYIRDHLDAVRASTEFIDELNQNGRRREAMTLCLVYIDRLAQRLYSDKPGPNFRNALINCSQDPLMGLVHPLQASRALLRTKNKDWHKIAGTISGIYTTPPYELIDLANFEAVVAKHLGPTEVAHLKDQSWRFTMAQIAYEYLRNDAIHGYGNRLELEFAETTYNGKAVPTLNFQRFKSCLLALIDEALRRSVANEMDWS